jgi:hypothetical protein
MENPSLEDIRDACADLKRRDEESEKEEVDDDGDDDDDEIRFGDPRLGHGRKSGVPSKWKGKAPKLAPRFAPSTKGDGPEFVDFGKPEANSLRTVKMRVRVCGKHIWNYASETAMSRRGWLNFCIIAKDCTLFDAMGLCRTWDEFMELNQLTSFHYFPGYRWQPWVEHREQEQLLHLGLAPYFVMMDAPRQTIRHQTGSRGSAPRQHYVAECKNMICGYMKRNDAVSRRFIQYLVMNPRGALILVRDGRTGKIITRPPEEHLWVARRKSGLGRANKHGWVESKQVGGAFFAEMDGKKKWEFAFDDYYEVFIWDLETGTPFGYLYDYILSVSSDFAQLLPLTTLI